MAMNSINEPCYGILCHRQYVDRVSNAMLGVDDEWITIHASGEDAICPSHVPPTKQHSSNKCLIIPTCKEKGPRKDRTGYSLLVLQDCIISPAVLPPTARRQLSWAGRLTRKTEIIGQDQNRESNTVGKKRARSNESEDEQTDSYIAIINKTATEMWKELVNDGFDIEKDILRIDVHPKKINSNSEVCLALQQAAKRATSSTSDGPIKLALSAAVATIVLNVVFQSQNTAFWGTSTSNEHFEQLNQKLNDYATKEVVVEATDSKSGLDKSSCQLLSTVPVSRAHYKLSQVFEDENLLDKIASLRGIKAKGIQSKRMLLNHGSGLDVGASPGGWTQVLCNDIGLETISLDPATLAQRVEVLDGVTHVRAELSSKEAIAGMAQATPYSTIVCDASLSNPTKLIEKITHSLESISALLHESGNEKRVVTWPLCTVFTLKFPHKTSGSIDRHTSVVLEALPNYFKRMAMLDGEGSVEVIYKICHLFANSISERTVIALFYKGRR